MLLKEKGSYNGPQTMKDDKTVDFWVWKGLGHKIHLWYLKKKWQVLGDCACKLNAPGFKRSEPTEQNRVLRFQKTHGDLHNETAYKIWY